MSIQNKIMPGNIWEEIDQQLEGLAEEDLLRHRKIVESSCSVNSMVSGNAVLSFCSNDYLGLASDPELIEAACAAAQRWGVGSGASHVVSGHMQVHEQLEEALAAFVGMERALLFSTGYMANLGVVPALLGRGDAVFSDRLNHASLIDAVQLSRADHHRYQHNDMEQLERLLEASKAKRKLILTDAVFSMDGDLALLPHIVELAERYNAWLVVDDAHGFGVLGKEGKGSLSHFNISSSQRIIYVGTLGKAAGVSGAFVAASANVIEWLMQRSRTYIFTTGSSPIIAATLLASLTLIKKGDRRRAHLFSLIARLRDGLKGTNWQLMPSQTAIQPIIIGSNEDALNMASRFAERGMWVPAIRPPTVPKGSARLRISLSAAHSDEQVNRLITSLQEWER